MRRVGFFSGVSTFPSVPLSDGGDRGVAGFLELGDRALAAAQVATLITRKRIDYLYSWIELMCLPDWKKKRRQVPPIPSLYQLIQRQITNTPSQSLLLSVARSAERNDPQ